MALDEVRRSERLWLENTRTLRACAGRHRAALIVGGGFAAGLTTSLLPVAPLLRIGSAFAGTLSLMLKGPLSRLIAGHYQHASDSAHAAEGSHE